MNYLEEIYNNKSLKRWGYYVYNNGNKINHELGEDKIRNVWSGGNIKDVEHLFMKYSKTHPDKVYILFKSDGPHFATFLKDENQLFNLFHHDEVHKMKNVYIFCSSIKYCSIESLKSSHDFTNLKLLPTCFTKHFHEVQYIPNNPNWESKKDKAIWVGTTTGIYRENDYRGTRKHIYDAVKKHEHLVYFQFTNSHFSRNEVDISYKREIISKNHQQDYKMIICIDGWGFPGSLSWVLHSGCIPIIICEFKIGILKHLKPWVHYIPAKCDGSDVIKHVEWVLHNKDKAITILNNLHKQIEQSINPLFLQNELKHMF